MPTTKFRPAVRHGTGGPERMLDEIEGEAVDFGLVLHPRLMEPDGHLDAAQGMSISDPVTDYRVTGGAVREHALMKLYDMIEASGGGTEFTRMLAAARSRILSARDVAAKVAPVLHVVPATNSISEPRT